MRISAWFCRFIIFVQYKCSWISVFCSFHTRWMFHLSHSSWRMSGIVLLMQRPNSELQPTLLAAPGTGLDCTRWITVLENYIEYFLTCDLWKQSIKLAKQMFHCTMFWSGSLRWALNTTRTMWDMCGPSRRKLISIDKNIRYIRPDLYREIIFSHISQMSNLCVPGNLSGRGIAQRLRGLYPGLL